MVRIAIRADRDAAVEAARRVRYSESCAEITLNSPHIRARTTAVERITSGHNYITPLYEAGVNPLIAVKIAGHSDYQTTANIYTHLSEETMRQASVNLDEVFQKKAKKKTTKSGANARSRKPPVDTSLPWANKF